MTLAFYLLGIFSSLFILYAVARHDFVLLRQSISLRQVFDNAFISFFVSFIIARAAFALYTQTWQLFNPLRFFYLTKYWGLLPYAGFAGAIISILILFRKKKNKLRILDIYFLSFSPLILLDILLKSNHGILILIKIISVIVLVSFYGWFIKIHNKFTIKDGFITCMTLITYTLTTLALSVAMYGIYSQKYLWFNMLLLVTMISSSIFLFLVQKNIFNKQ